MRQTTGDLRRHLTDSKAELEKERQLTQRSKKDRVRTSSCLDVGAVVHVVLLCPNLSRITRLKFLCTSMCPVTCVTCCRLLRQTKSILIALLRVYYYWYVTFIRLEFYCSQVKKTRCDVIPLKFSNTDNIIVCNFLSFLQLLEVSDIKEQYAKQLSDELERQRLKLERVSLFFY